MMAHHHRVTADTRKPVSRFGNLGVALLLAGTFSLTANASSSSQPSKTGLPTLRFGGPSFVNLDPALDPDNSFIAWQVNAHLVRFLPSGKLAPDLATPSVSKNHRVYTFTIRHNARFSNGHAVTAQDVAFSFKRTLTPS